MSSDEQLTRPHTDPLQRKIHLLLTEPTGVVQHRKFLAANKVLNLLRETKYSPTRPDKHCNLSQGCASVVKCAFVLQGDARLMRKSTGLWSSCDSLTNVVNNMCAEARFISSKAGMVWVILCC